MKFEMSCKCEINSDSRIKMSEYLDFRCFMDDNDSEFMSYVMDILKLNKLPYTIIISVLNYSENIYP